MRPQIQCDDVNMTNVVCPIFCIKMDIYKVYHMTVYVCVCVGGWGGLWW